MAASISNQIYTTSVDAIGFLRLPMLKINRLIRPRVTH